MKKNNYKNRERLEIQTDQFIKEKIIFKKVLREEEITSRSENLELERELENPIKKENN